jgi:pimeloyl-ACP methyl ester carboxylesterase
VIHCERRSLSLAGASIAYKVCGEGAPLVLVHGLSASSGWWRRNVPALAAHYRTYLLDLPGFGSLRRLGRGFALARTTEWIRSVLDALAIETTCVIAHSMGALVGLGLAVGSPERVTRLVLVSPAIVLTNKTVWANLAPLLAAGRTLQPAFVPTLVHDAVRAGPFTLWRAARELLSFDAAEQLQLLRTPALIVHGERDTLVPLAAARVLRERIPHARLHVIAGAGHVPMFERAQEFNHVVLRFLAAEDTSS